MNKRDLYLAAAERISGHKETWSCIAILKTKYPKWGQRSIENVPEIIDYVALMSPQPGGNDIPFQIAIEWDSEKNKSRDSNEACDLRVLLLLFMAEVVR